VACPSVVDLWTQALDHMFTILILTSLENNQSRPGFTPTPPRSRHGADRATRAGHRPPRLLYCLQPMSRAVRQERFASGVEESFLVHLN
jgi:hypothetical protein